MAEQRSNAPLFLAAIAAGITVLLVRRARASRPEPAGGSFAAGVLAIAKEDLAARIREPVRKVASQEIRDLYLAPLGLPDGDNWCAAAVASWLRRAAKRTGHPSPIAGSGGAKETMRQLQRAVLWIDRADLRPEDVRPGMISVWDRSDPKRPETSWWGHIGVVAGPVDASGVYLSVEGNSGNGGEVAEMRRRLDDPRLLGMGRFQ